MNQGPLPYQDVPALRVKYFALDHLAASGYPLDPADVARLTPLGHPTINLDGRYRTTSRPPATGHRPLRID